MTKTKQFLNDMIWHPPWEHKVGLLLDLLKPNHVDIVNVIQKILWFNHKHLHQRPQRFFYRTHGGSWRVLSLSLSETDEVLRKMFL